MNIFLGNPPENIKKWIIEHYAPPTPVSGPLCFTAEQDGSSVSLVYQDSGESDPTASKQSGPATGVGGA